MKKLFLVTASLLLATLTVFGQAQNQPGSASAAEQERIRQLDKGIFVVRLAPLMENIQSQKIMIPKFGETLAEDYTRINAKGQLITREQELTWFEEAKPPITLSGNFKAQLNDVQVQVYESVAVVKERVEIEKNEQLDFEPPGKYQVTNIYTKRDNKWLLISSQWTAIVTN